MLFGLVLGLMMMWASAAAAQLLPPEPGSITLRVMTFNIWLGGELVDFNSVVDVIRVARADVVGVQEAGGNLRRLADALGGWYADERTHIISRYPIITPPGAEGDYVFIQPRPGSFFAVMNVHLPSDPYGPYLLRDGVPLDEVLATEERVRLAPLLPLLRHVPALRAAGIPVVLTGDFNSPSHLDWTGDENGVQRHVREGLGVRWPVTVALEQAGFIDTWRAQFPDPGAHPGFTWTYGAPYPRRVSSDEEIDRIDMVLVAGDVSINRVEMVGPFFRSGTEFPTIYDPYPSDHRAVSATLTLRTGRARAFVSPDRRILRPGDPLVVRYGTPGGEATDRITLVARGGSVDRDALFSLPPMEAELYGSVTFGTALLAPGEYEVVLTTSGDEIARAPVTLFPPDARPLLESAKAVYAPDEPIVLSWSYAPGNRFDWIAIYPAGAVDLYNDYLAYAYTGSERDGRFVYGEPFGSVRLDRDASGEPLRLEPGEYAAYLLLDDVYQPLAVTRFTVGGG
jgi:endonuclease/exonuclease/phosphatase family metal-dependent hydrolase